MSDRCKFETLEFNLETGERVIAIKFLDGPFEGLVTSFGKVEFEEADPPIMKFDYHIHQNIEASYTLDELKQELGDFILSMIEEQLSKNELVYTGNKNGEDDIIAVDAERTVCSEGDSIS